MTPIQLALQRLARDLRRLDRRWALVGGLAISVHAEPRTTRDVDVAVSVSSDGEAEQLVAALFRIGYRSEGTLEQTATDRFATMRLKSPIREDEVIVDLLFASSGIEPEIATQANDCEVLPGLWLPVARPGHLMALKVLAGRSHDLGDLGQLLRSSGPDALGDAREALQLITRRGFHRDKDLVAEFDRLVELGPDQL